MTGLPTFKRVVEDFTCGFCGTSVKGKGYTNHCPECLWSSHVDVNPGDRASKCGGLMKPHSVVFTRSNYTITHKCLKCGKTKNVEAAPDDSRDALSARIKPGPIIV